MLTETFTRWQIEGQVIVDQTLAISRNPKWHQELDFDQTMLTKPDKRETHIPTFCMHPKTREGCKYFNYCISNFYGST